MGLTANIALRYSKDLIQSCLASQEARIERGAKYRNVFLTGDDNGDPQTYPYTYSFIDNLSSLLYSPVELRLRIEQDGPSDPNERAKFYTASSTLHRYMRRGGVDTEIEDAVTWSLVKGKSFVKLLWSKEGFEPYIVQPETFGVLREDIDSLDRQDAFVHSSYFTRDRFAQLVQHNPERDDIMRKVERFTDSTRKGDNPAAINNMRQVILGGVSPYQPAGRGGASKNRGMVDWLGAPSPDLSPEVMIDLIRVDELWVWDETRDDYITMQVAADDVMITSKDRHRNLFADMYDPHNPARYLPADENNPLTGQHPFTEICPNRLNGYFWGRSEICNVGLLQKSINQRVNGINGLLRLQEDPPRAFSGGGPPNQQAYNKLKKPGGYLVEPQGGNFKVQSLAPDLPAGLWDSLHELEGMYEKMAGLTPTLAGRGEHGVRAAGHSDRLTSNASPRFKDRALIIERQVEALGGKALDMLKAKVPDNMTAWLMPGDKSIETSMPPENELEQPPAPGMLPLEFTFHDLSDHCAVRVDSHSGSPVFMQETRDLLFNLFKAGLVKGEELIERLHPPGADAMIEDIKKSEIAKQEFSKQHPELAAQAEEKAAGKKKK